MSTFITKLDATGTGPRVAVKDLVDVEGVPTTAGCRAVERDAKPAERDAACLAGFRAADARLVGKANLHELAMLPLGTNPWFGTPVNPLDPELIPGGSSSGSAVSVANGDADVAIGSDTGGSIRVPSACCGTTGLKTTHGRISIDGVWPLAPSLDTLGPMAVDVAGCVLGMQLFEPGFRPADSSARTIGRIRTSGNPDIEAAIDAALRAAELDVVTIEWEAIEPAAQAFAPIYCDEVWDLDHELVTGRPDAVGADIAAMIEATALFRPAAAESRRALAEWKSTFFSLFDRVELLALPTLPIFPPRIDAIDAENMLATVIEITGHVAPFNATGVPATAQPVPVAGGGLPASLQLVGPLGGEELLLTTAQRVETAVGG
jgi:amidase